MRGFSTLQCANFVSTLHWTLSCPAVSFDVPFVGHRLPSRARHANITSALVSAYRGRQETGDSGEGKEERRRGERRNQEVLDRGGRSVFGGSPGQEGARNSNVCVRQSAGR